MAKTINHHRGNEVIILSLSYKVRQVSGELTFPPKLKSSRNVTFSFSFCLRLTGAVCGEEGGRGGGRVGEG